MGTAKVTNITENMRRVSGFLIVIICAVVLHSSCARKVAQSIERTHDTLIVYKTDSVMVRDTIVAISNLESMDSVAERMATYVVVDTAGKVLTKYVYRDRSVYHNKDALSASSHVSCRTHRTNSTSHKATVRDAVNFLRIRIGSTASPLGRRSSIPRRDRELPGRCGAATQPCRQAYCQCWSP